MVVDLSVALGGDRDTPRPMVGPRPQSMDLEAAARVLGVHYQTAYRWVRTGVLPAVKVCAEYRLTVEDVQRFADLRRSGQAVCYTGRKRDWAGLVDQFYGAAVAGDETGARRVFQRLHLARVPMLEQCEQLVVPFARRLEADFADGVLLAGHVRLAAAVCERQLHWASGLVRERGNLTAAVVTPAGEPHRLPIVMASSVLRAEGWTVVRLHGGVTSGRDLVGLADRMPLRLIAVSATIMESAAKDLAADVGQVLRVPVLIGGPGAPLQELLDAASVARELLPG